MAGGYKNAAVRIEGPDFYELRDEFRKLPKRISDRVIGAALKRATQPMVRALQQVTPVGPTGNLRRAIKTVAKKYKNTGTVVAVVGYVKAGTGRSKSAQGGRVKKGADRAFHQFWLEFGTKERYTTGNFASSFNSLGPFKIKSTSVKAKRSRRLLRQAQRLERRAGKQRFQDEASAASMMRRKASGLRSDAAMYSAAASRVTTSPAYPRAFFKKGREAIRLPPVMPQYPVHTAYKKSRSQVESNLLTEMRKAVENGRKIFEDEARRKAQMRDLGRHL